MATLSSLVHELRERIAASSSSPPSNGGGAGDDALETRFRAVLPNLLHIYVVPSPSANEREVIAVLKLISYIAKNFSGVFYHGKASSILPVVGRILPFFAEPVFRSRHGVIFETVGSLLSLLRTGTRDAYRLFFADAMLVVEDLFYVASGCTDQARTAEPTRLTLRCFLKSFNGGFNDPAHLGDIPVGNKPADGNGILINLTGQARWQPFATWMIRLLSKCLTEGTLCVEGLLNVPFVISVCSLLCYGDADLHMACFDFASIIASAINFDIVPHQNLILSISNILMEDKEGLPVFRNVVYDSSLGGCLNAIYSCCSDAVVKLTAADLVNVFPQAMRRTKSQELKVALCSAYIRIAKSCSPRVWRPQSLIYVLSTPEPCFPLIDCFQVAISVLGPVLVGGKMTNCKSVDLLMLGDESIGNLRVGEKRPLPVMEACMSKRVKVDEACIEAKCHVNEEPYEVSLDNYGCCDGPRTGRLRASNNAPKLFSGLNFYFMGDFVASYKEDLEDLVIAAGGTVLKSREELIAQSYEESTQAATALVVYNIDPPEGCKLGDEVAILFQRLSEAEDIACQTGSKVIGHTWLLESIAGHKLQPIVS